MKHKILHSTGLFFFFLSIVSPLLAFLVPILGLSHEKAAIVIGFLMVGAPELFLITGAALAGKRTAIMIKKKLKKLFGELRIFKPAGKTRYTIGLILFSGSILSNWILSYVNQLMELGIEKKTFLTIALTLDMITIFSFFVLGGQFWHKIQRLFVWDKPET